MLIHFCLSIVVLTVLFIICANYSKLITYLLMRRINKQIGNKNRVLVIVLFILASLIILFFLPNLGKFKYEYQKGQPWKHDDLISPFDFAILKSDNEYRTERDSIARIFAPYFKNDPEIYNRNLNEFNQAFTARYAESIVALRNRYPNKILSDTLKRFCKKYSQNILNDIYTKGVVNYTDIIEQVKHGHTIVVVNQNIATKRDVDNLFTQKIAYSYITKKLDTDFPDKQYIKSLIESLKIYDFVEQNLFYDQTTSGKVKADMTGQISISLGMVQAGERIISKGEMVNTENYRVLESLRKEYTKAIGSNTSFRWIYIGYWLLLMVSLGVLYLFLFNFRREILDSFKKSTFIIVLVVIMVVSTSIVVRYNSVSIYLLPFAMIPIIINAFYDSRLAFFIHLVTIMICGFLVPNGFEFIFLQFVAGAVSIFRLTQMYKRGHLFFSVAVVILSYLITYSALSIIQEGDLASINYRQYLWFLASGLLLLSTYPLIFLFEKLFGFISDVTLVELTDTNHPVLRELAEKAPGTFQHVMMVANLSEDAIRKIGGNPLLMRVGALYHDIGKTGAPGFFVENQVGGNPHDRLAYEKSAEVIIEHVNYGVRLAKKHHLPQSIIDFIVTHHGNSLVKYFYNKYANEHPNQIVDESKFMYPGPTPFSKETAVLMMADAVEAASRTLKEYNEKTIDELVERIISNQLNDNQFEEADITFRDIYIIKNAFKQKLLNIYHARIEYPERIK